LATALQDRILAIGRDALIWLEKVKKLHSQIQETLVNVPLFEHNVAMILENRFNKIKGETSALKNSIARLTIWDNKTNTWEIPPAIPLGHLERIRKAYKDILVVARTLLISLKGLREGVAKELEEDAYIMRDMAGLETIVWKMDEVTAPPAHSAVRRLISQTRYGERKEKTMSRHVKIALNAINGTVSILEDAIPKISAWENELGKSTAELLPRVMALEQNKDREGMAIFFMLFLRAAEKVSSNENMKRIRRVAIEFTSLVSRMERIKGEIENLEARQGTLLKELEKAIEKFEKRGWLEKAVA
jgi:hypothetical protein